MGAPQQRQPRFKRAPTAAISITERDLDIIRLIYKHRFLQPMHLEALLDIPYRPLMRRLNLLFHHGYLDRPRAQLEYFGTGGNVPIAHAVGNKGADLLAEHDATPRAKVDWTWKNRDVGQRFIRHTLLVADVLVSVEVACLRNPALRYIDADEILHNAPARTQQLVNPFKWSTHVAHNGMSASVSTIPDGIFGIEFTKEKTRSYFFLEADRSTMPVIRTNLAQTSILRKLYAYYDTWRTKAHTEHFGFRQFRVLFVTTSTERVNHIIEANKTVVDGAGSRIFLVGDASAITSEAVLEKQWKNGQDRLTKLTD